LATSFMCLATCSVLTLDATWVLASFNREIESATDRTILFSSISLQTSLSTHTLTVAVKGRWPFAKLNTKGLSADVVPKLLSGSEIADRLRPLSGWKRDGKFITKSFEFHDFLDGIDFINRVAAVAEKEEHHPDIHVRYTKITLSAQTHSEGGVTEWDLELAAAIEAMLNGAGATRQRAKNRHPRA